MKVLLLFLAGSVAFAGWEAAQRVSPDHKIEVATHVGKSTRGPFVSATETALVVRSKSGEHSIARGDIHRVRIADPSRRARNGLIASSIDAGVGLAIGAAGLPAVSERRRAKYMGPLTAAGAGAGAAAGFRLHPTVPSAKACSRAGHGQGRVLFHEWHKPPKPL